MNVEKDKEKIEIGETIFKEMKDKGYTIRELGEMIGMKHPQIVRVYKGENYNIDTLLRVLEGLDLEIIIQRKKQKEE